MQEVSGSIPLTSTNLIRTCLFISSDEVPIV